MKNFQLTTKLSCLDITNSNIYKTIHDDISTTLFISTVTKLLTTKLDNKFLFLCAATSIDELEFIEDSLGDDVRTIHSKQSKQQKMKIVSEWEKGQFSTIITIRNIYDIDINTPYRVNIIMCMNLLPNLFLEKARTKYIGSMFYFVDFNSSKCFEKKTSIHNKKPEETKKVSANKIDINSYTVLLAKIFPTDHHPPRKEMRSYSINCNKKMIPHKTQIYIEGVDKPIFYDQVIQLRIKYYEEFLKYPNFFLLKHSFSSKFEFHIFFCTTNIKIYAINCLRLLQKRTDNLNSKQNHLKTLLKRILKMKTLDVHSKLYREMYGLLDNKLAINYLFENEVISRIRELKEAII